MLRLKIFGSVLIGLLVFSNAINIIAQQINISRVELMPNLPSPYLMRDWKQATIGYDNFVFDFNLTGQYLPLVWLNTNTINYPDHNSFGLHTVVGTLYPESAEAINLLPAVISASLVGIDKSNQNGYNWVLMCEEYFNKDNDANIYLNHPNGSNWDDWWYDTMPNIFFYQLYSIYPNVGDFNYQFTSVADRWLQSIGVMGGSTAPWHIPNMNYRAFNLLTMTPYSLGVPEPEASGALAWIFYDAFVETGNPDYRIGAELSLEFLNGLTSNPSYELQLSYGVYTAARMNAEIGTTYDIEKLINWCFNVGPLRDWGTIVGHWGNYNVHGLVGEVNGSNDYAFLMNSFEQVGALVPLVRYDDRFARAIGKWVLNASSAIRLLYTNYLPDHNQDSEEWAHVYDPNSYIGHEALRQSQYGQSPYATGDAIDGGWGWTNLALYGSSHIGILGGIIDTTNIEKILQLDLLKTDYFHDQSYPSYLIFNPYSVNKDISFDAGGNLSDIYDAASNTFIKYGVSGSTILTIPADEAIVAVVVPSGGAITYDLDKMSVNGIVVDYRSGQTVANYPPRIKSLSADSTTVITGAQINVYCTASDRDADTLGYYWTVSGGSINGSGAEIEWFAPANLGVYKIYCNVQDGNGGEVTDSISVDVVKFINTNPVISKITATPRKIHIGTQSTVNCNAYDPDGDEITYAWSSQQGSFTGSGMQVTWTAPIEEGNYFLNCMVDDGRGGQTFDSLLVSVRDTSINQTGNLVAYYPFNGNANDESGYNNNGTVNGPLLVSDRFGNPNSAYQFDGVNDFIDVQNSSSLNFENSISVNFWIKVGEFFNREAYPLSHGNWENRWKVSITNKGIRWTVKTTSGIKDLDSETELVLNTLYNVTVLYSGSDYEIYLNGKLDAISSYSGTILPTSINFLIGQVLPGNNEYNFKGVLDDIRIYDYAISYNKIQDLYDLPSSVEGPGDDLIPKENVLNQNYPNPFNNQTVIKYQIKETDYVQLGIFNSLGERIRTLVNQHMRPGYYSASWNGKDDSNSTVSSGVYFYQLRTKDFVLTRKLILIK